MLHTNDSGPLGRAEEPPFEAFKEPFCLQSLDMLSVFLALVFVPVVHLHNPVTSNLVQMMGTI